ncbi:MAG: hypothetical protein WB791_04755 [Waddliaceae bacterium]
MTTQIRTSILIWPFYLLLVAGIFFPSTAHHGILNPKSFLFIATIIGVSVYACMKQRLLFSQINIFCFLLLSLSFLIVWFFIGIALGTSTISSAFDQYKLFLITIIVPAFTAYLLNEKQIDPQTIIKLVIYVNLAYCLLKILIISLHFMSLLNLWELRARMGLRIQKTAIFGNVERVQSSVDISTPFILFFVLQSNALGLSIPKWTRSLYFFVSFLSNLLSFSRFLLFVYCFSIALHLFTSTVSRIFKSLIMVIGLLTLFAAFIGFENIETAIHHRFFSEGNRRSDDIRYQQTRSLMKAFDHSPYVGQGLGSYVKDNVRDGNLLHSYEVQWVAFLMQFGLIGIVFLFLPLGYVLFRLLLPPLSREKIAFSALFMLWILSGFTNPFLISLQSGILYALFIAVSKISSCFGISSFNQGEGLALPH